ncbi:hypothetical protein JQU17_06620 [Ponticoccus sp. SC2-23]|uniref:hypothetical protein n=1 Tax=Alexandriicola marinus TaxID=2081710 RepID=UPI000FDA9360|nr:hypothetical protein [Alexandriicola marinus]MBM1220641.1 hypothetical protein [Ponticoccus sp. SC6-9]MBM1225327.1 hypothetical protein [Ponticoccus sp. SC6-15]MBM1228841.1 hypothetical protein [Ponticoccus sp. SC6-38]MBM1233522.1 hypothetical protein [Ponticoccus sp. SC6-45]MBM1239342.1 hypothetical protein [Ponticoccus sp. SC6-49]MBM1243124.1 hypothetical protein [Ponticoccus sp. SC2-64]MBM1247046.1 hypothetical protein [Ponticoccus sp. SC6-42]MBM1252295.1 hypothetical protein [Pontico
MIRIAALLLFPVSAVAQAPVTLPVGCDAYVTIQKRSCIVSHVFTCDTDPAGHQRRVDYDATGMTYMGRIDSETQWIESFHVRAQSVERLSPQPADPASFSELVATGIDSWDFQTTSDPFAVTVYRGFDRLTGATVTIDGVPLEETEFEVTVTDGFGEFLWSVEGREFIHRDWRIFLSGVRTMTTPIDEYQTDGRPVEFIFPGEQGFLSAEPRHDCGEMISKGS